MAAILRSSVIQTVRRAFSGSGEGTLSVRALHTGRSNRTVYASCAKQNTKPAEVDPFLKKNDDISRKELVVGYTERLLKGLKSNTSSPPHLDPWFWLVSMAAVGTFMLGYQVGLAEKRRASSGKQA